MNPCWVCLCAIEFSSLDVWLFIHCRPHSFGTKVLGGGVVAVVVVDVWRFIIWSLIWFYLDLLVICMDHSHTHWVSNLLICSSSLVSVLIAFNLFSFSMHYLYCINMCGFGFCRLKGLFGRCFIYFSEPVKQSLYTPVKLS